MRLRIRLVLALLVAVGLGFTAGYELHNPNPTQGQNTPSSRPAAAIIATVPNVISQTQASAEAALTGSGLGVRLSKAFSNSVPKGLVVAEAPVPGSRVEAGTQVELTVSSGRAP